MNTANLVAPKHLTKDDLIIGQVIYVCHPFYGIDKYLILSEPYINEYTKSLFVKTKVIYDDAMYDHDTSLCDAGLGEHSYNLRRTFDNLKDALQYKEYMLTLESTHLHQLEHEAMVSAFYDDEVY